MIRSPLQVPEEVEKLWVESSAVLHELVEQKYRVSIGRSSFQPLLSDLKSKGIITRDEQQRIALASRVREFMLS